MAASIATAPEEDVVYGEKVLTVEPYTVEQIPLSERHGHASHLFPLWLGANLTIADFALGFLPISLGVSWPMTIGALILGNILGGALLALASSMGPGTGWPQMIAGRLAFGRVGEYLPAAFNWLSTVGWFTVNNILGSFGLQVLFPSLPFWSAALILVVVQVTLAVFGHNLIHSYERLMSVVLGVLFLIATVRALQHFGTITSFHPKPAAPALALFAIVLAAAFSYIASWAPYASDYSRYLPPQTPVRSTFAWTFLGSVIASFWLEILGCLIAVLAPAGLNPIAALHSVMGGFGGVAVAAIILGATAADALNLYSNALSARALDLRVPRPLLAVVAGAVGLGLSIRGSGQFAADYESFLLLLAYWVTPWLAILFADYFLLGNRSTLSATRRSIHWPALISYLVGLAVSVPFMSDPGRYTGFLASHWYGADFSYYIGFVVAGGIYLLWQRQARRLPRKAHQTDFENEPTPFPA